MDLKKQLTSPPAIVMYFSVPMLAGIVLLAVLPGSNSISIPPPQPHDKALTVAHHRSTLVDSSRKDPFNDSHDRKVELSLFIPIENKVCSGQCENDYMPDQTAKVSNLQFFGDEKANFFEQLRFDSCCSASGDIEAGKFPLVVFEPTVGTSRLVYNQLARQLSAVGAAVVLLDHPYDASIVEFNDASLSDKEPIRNDGKVQLDPFQAGTLWNDTMDKVHNTRRDDIDFVLSQLGSTDILKKFFPDFNFNSSLDTKKFLIVGHGMGGTVATVTSIVDGRSDMSINLAGTIPKIQNDVKDYIVFFGRDGYTRNDDPNWRDSAKHFVGRTVEWDSNKGGQMDYTDLPLLVSIVQSSQKAKGLGENGVWAFHCTSCFLEAYIRTTVFDERGEIGACIRICPFIVPLH